MSEPDPPRRRTPAPIAVGLITMVAIAAVTSAMVAARLLPAQAEDEARPIKVGESVEGTLGGQPDRWTLEGIAGETVVIEMHKRGGGLDPYLHLADPRGALIAEDDDSAGDLNSRISHTFVEDGPHTIQASGLGRSRGAYTLSVRETAASRRSRG